MPAHHLSRTPVPSAGMIRIRFNGFAIQHLRRTPPRRLRYGTTLAVSPGEGTRFALKGGSLSQSCHASFVKVPVLTQGRVIPVLPAYYSPRIRQDRSSSP